MDSVHATSHGMQNIAATVWFRNVTIDRLCLPVEHGMGTNRWTIVLCGGLRLANGIPRTSGEGRRDGGQLRKGATSVAEPGSGGTSLSGGEAPRQVRGPKQPLLKETSTVERERERLAVIIQIMNAIANATAHAKGSTTSRRNRNEFSKFRLLSERVESLDVDRSDRRFDAPVARFREEFWLARLGWARSGRRLVRCEA